MGNGLTIKKVSYDIYDISIDNISMIMRLFNALVINMGLHPHGNASWQFLTPWDTGGTGITVIQSFTESYMVIGTWSEKKYANLFICSCKAFDVEVVRTTIEKLFPGSVIACDVLSEVKL